MKQVTQKREKDPNKRKKLFAALAMLIVATILLGTTSFAWLVLSISPEVTGITTNVGANGSLEIALLNTKTAGDKSQIRTAVIGETLSTNKLSANETWGNLIDLSDTGYGLDKLVLSPARLNAAKTDDGYKMNGGYLSAPTYGFDGRVVEVSEDTVTAIYDKSEKQFIKKGDLQDYGVRAIGTSESLSVQGSALALAKGNIRSYMINAQSAAKNSIENNDLQTFLLKYIGPGDSYNQADLAVLDGMISGLSTAEGYIEQAIRYGLVAVAASKLESEDAFDLAEQKILDDKTTLKQLLEAYPDYKNESITTMVEAHAKLENDIANAKSQATLLSGKDSITEPEIIGVLNCLMNLDGMYVGDKLLKNMEESELIGMLGGIIDITLGAGSGIFDDIANFTGNFTASVGNNIQMKTVSAQNPSYLEALYTFVTELSPAGGTGENVTKYDLNVTYGYALDFAFRCNAEYSQLLLQTTPEQRVYSDSTSAGTLGGGSYMSFDPTGTDYEPNRLLDLMNAVRVAFVDDLGNILGIARLNTSNWVSEGTVVKAPLYLYDYEIGTEGDELGVLLMGERQKNDNAIVELIKNTPTHITTVVWLDGDLVDNTMVPNTMENCPAGLLNLQFASSADLTPAGNKALFNYEISKDGLTQAIAAAKPIFDAKQGIYTTLSWSAFEKAYSNAQTVLDDSAATVNEISRAIWRLTNAKEGLEKTDQATLRKKIEDVRTLMGKTDDIYAIAINDAKTGNTNLVADAYTKEQKEHNNGIIYRVDYNKNLKDEGNGVYSRIYTNESWTNLATALYNAEFVDLCSKVESQTAIKPGTADWDLAITALDQAKTGLQRAVYYTPYEYKGTLFYKGITTEENPDTYELWYYKDLTRVFSDVLVMELDAYAVPTQIAELQVAEYSSNKEVIRADVNILDGVYDCLQGENFIASQWIHEGLDKAVTAEQRDELEQLKKDVVALYSYSDATRNAEAALLKFPLLGMSEYNSVYSVLNELLLAAKPNDNQPQEPVTVTENQKQVIAKAVTLAKGVEGYGAPENPENENLPALRTAVANAEAAMEATTTKIAAQAAINALNSALAKFDITAVTEYNTITYTLPEGYDVTELVYSPEYNFELVATNDEGNFKTGDFNFSGVLLTESGILVKISATTTVYSPAGGVQLPSITVAPQGGEIAPYDLDIKYYDDDFYTAQDYSIKENNYKISGAYQQMWNHRIWQGQTVTFDQPVFKDKLINCVVGGVIRPLYTTPNETIESVEWSSTNAEILTVDQNGVVTAVGEGTAKISAFVTTVQGNVYAVESDVITVYDEPSTIASVSYNAKDGVCVAKLTNGTEEIKSVSWSTDKAEIATIDSNGKLTVVADGEVTITAKIITDSTNTEITATAPITVQAPAKPN